MAWVHQADGALALCVSLAAQISDWRRGSVRHTLETLVRQRVYQIVCGYEDQHAADSADRSATRSTASVSI
ncbi:MAG: transposase [Ktedonobacterales bacterium]